MISLCAMAAPQTNFRPPTLNSDVNLIMTVHVLVSLVRIASQGHRKHANKSQIS